MPASTGETRTDVLVVGPGAAGLSAALAAAGEGARVVLAGPLGWGNSWYAQGGLAAALAAGDSPERHAQDTLRAGGGWNLPAAVRILTEEGVRRARDLVAWGGAFDRTSDGRLDLSLEAGHSTRRILHAYGGATGRAVMEVLEARVAGAEGITLRPDLRAVDLATDGVRCTSALFQDGSGAPVRVRAGAVVLATGGAAGLFRRNTNPPGSRGDGWAMGYRVGAELADLEFVQFHPTVLAVPGCPALLLSEALRGEGALVVNARGERFLARYHPDGELAPRDVVARAIARELQEGGTVHLSLRHLDPECLQKRFYSLRQRLQDVCGLDLYRDPIPVAPAAHFCIGGLATDLEGATSVPGLFACGEVAATGVHGANRLASNSLLECLVFGWRAGRAAARSSVRQPDGASRVDYLPFHELPGGGLGDLAACLESLAGGTPVAGQAAIPPGAAGGAAGAATLPEPDIPLGVLRDGQHLTAYGAALLGEARRVLAAARPAPVAEVNRLTALALLTIACTWRRESRGAHFRVDHPEPRPDFDAHLFVSRSAGARPVRVGQHLLDGVGAAMAEAPAAC